MRDTIFLDIGGVFLTNGWDRAARRRTLTRFQIDGDEFENRHRAIVEDFETGRMSLDAYLDCTIFFQSRPFGREEVTRFMFAQSEPNSEALSLLAELAHSGRFLLAALNNESRELNQYRIERYGLRDHLRVFLSSCFLGVRKPDPRIYRLALDLTQRRAGDCIFVDDREANVEAARSIGMHSIQYRSVGDLQGLLK
jgi:putative hydrolase of the HAD superfamily